MRLKIVFILFFAISSVFMARAVFAYDNQTTHPALTDEAIDFYNAFFDKKITPEEKEWLVQGSIDEDIPPRWINHFYDPIYKQGWTGEYGSAVVPQELLRAFSDVFLSSEQAVSTINWVHNQELQQKYKLYQGNQTWEKALYEYVKNKNEKEAFLALGYVLHLAEDMTVPDHTRNDTHPEDSPYENFAKNFTRNNLNVWQDFKSQNFRPKIFGSVDEYFEYLSGYSNNYFFSKDTINIEKYNKPKIVEEDNNFGFGVDKDNFKFSLVKVKKEKIGDYEFTKIYDIKDENSVVLSAYFSRLSREAILSGSGIINLFFQEAERAEKDPSLLKPPPESRSAIISVFGEGTKSWNFMISAANWTLNSYLGLGESILDITWGIGNYFNDNGTYVISRESLVAGTPLTLDLNSENPPANEQNQNPPAPEQTSENPVAPNIALPAKVSLPVSFTEVAPPQKTMEVRPPEPEPPANPAGLAGVPIFSLISVPVGAGGGFSVGLDSESSVSNEPIQPLPPPPEEPSKEEPLPPPLPPPPDTTPPNVSFGILECQNSISTDGCFLMLGAASATTTLHLNWQSQADDLDFFELNQSGISATTTSTSTMAFIQNNSIANFSLRAKDTTGNWSEPISIIVEISSMPVVINEVAWMGTPADYHDEWIELYNNSSKDINLNGWVLRVQDNRPYINLSGIIMANSYYLLERKDDETVSDISADLIYGNDGDDWALNNFAERLILSFASTTIDETATCDGNWCGGNSDGRTLERFDPEAPGNDSNNWGTNDLFFTNGKSAGLSFAPLAGTPKARNSISYKISKNNFVSANLTLKKSRSPYIVYNTFINIAQNATLTIEPGVVIKFYNNAGMVAYGKIISQGAENKPIVFTSFYDDDNESGGDTNIDATSTVPHPADWFGVTVLSSASGSVFDHSVFRYGGKYYHGGGTSCGILTSDNADITISNSVFEYSRVCGLNLINNNSLISNSVFRNNSADASSAGISADNGSPTIQNNRFEANTYGVRLSNVSASLISNIFSNNIVAPIYSSGSLGVFEGNSGNGNGFDAIVLSGAVTRSGESKVLKPNGLFYSTGNRDGFSVSSGSTLTVGKGVAFKAQSGGYIYIYGDLIIDGNEASDILFTVADNAGVWPGAWNGVYVMPGGVLKGRGFTFSYAGGPRGFSEGGFQARQANIELNNVLFEYNYGRGLYLLNSVSKIENSIFRNHTDPGFATAILYGASPIYLKNVSFVNNGVAISADPSSTVELAENLIFENNTATTSPADLLDH